MLVIYGRMTNSCVMSHLQALCVHTVNAIPSPTWYMNVFPAQGNVISQERHISIVKMPLKD